MKTLRLSSLLLAACGALAISPGSSLRAQTIPKGNIVVDLDTFATLPNSGSNLPARVNVLRAAPDGRIFVNDQRGTLYTVTANGLTVTTYLKLSSLVPLLSDDGERGFQSFAFHPDFNNAGTAGYGKFYTMASQTDTGTTATFLSGNGARDHDEVLLEWTAANPAAGTFTAANAAQPFREVLRIARPASNHNAGYLSYNPTAPAADRLNLYLGTGDSGGGGDPLGLAQMPGKVYGAILRINPLLPAAGTPNISANGQYSIPTDNPYVNNAALLKEKYMSGFRNPQRFTWDSANGRMFIADIGQNNVEEIDVAQAGANYGWNQREGSYLYNANGSIGADMHTDTATSGFTYPIAEYFHYSGSGNAVTTGPVYRGFRIAGLNGRLLFSDFVNGVPYTLNANTLPTGGQGGITELRLRRNGTEMSFLAMIQQVNPNAGRADLRFGTDAQGNIYFLDKQDGVIRRVRTAATATATAVVTDVDMSVISQDAGQVATLTFTRSGDLSAPLEVPYTVSGRLVAGRDYKALKGTKTIPAGQRTAIVKIRPLPGGATGKVKLMVPAGLDADGTAAATKITVTVTE